MKDFSLVGAPLRLGILTCFLSFMCLYPSPAESEVVGWTRYYKEWKKLYDTGNLQQALEVANKELEKHPNSYNALGLRCRTYIDLHQFDKALADAMARMPLKVQSFEEPDKYWLRAQAYMGLGKWEEAYKDLRIYETSTGQYAHLNTELQPSIARCQKKLEAASDTSTQTIDVQALAKQLATVMKQQEKSKVSEETQADSTQNDKLVNRPIRDKWALVIGISKFADPAIPSLKYAAKDARDFSEFLVSKANFAPDHVRLLLNENATQRRILDEIGDKFLPRVVKPDDLVVIYYSSHGSPSRADVRGKNFLITHDSERPNLYASGIEMQQLTEIINDRVRSDRVLLVLDACHSGATTPGEKSTEPAANFNLQSISLGHGQTAICSSKADERSWESKRYENGIFTKKLMQALLQNGQNTSIDEAFKYLGKEVEDEVQQDNATQQTPVLQSTWKGNNLILSIPPSAPEPMPESVKTLLKPDSTTE